MEGPPTEYQAAEEVAFLRNSNWANDVSTSMAQRAGISGTRQQGPSAEDVTCEALHLALSAIHIDIAWHAGAISAEAAMKDLDREIGRTTSRYSPSTRARASEVAVRAPTGAIAIRATPFVEKTEYD
jgi:hypothetical protein